MFKLGTERTEPVWLDLPQGVRLQMRPLDAAIVIATRARALRAIAERVADHPPEAGPDLANPDMGAAALQTAFAGALAYFGAIAWEGVGDDNDQPAPFTREAAERLGRHPVMTEAVLSAYFATLEPTEAATTGQAAPSAPSSPEPSPPPPPAGAAGNRKHRRADAARHRQER